jgi:hypothetical protein
VATAEFRATGRELKEAEALWAESACLVHQVGELKQQSVDVTAEQVSSVGRSGGDSSTGEDAATVPLPSRHRRSPPAAGALVRAGEANGSNCALRLTEKSRQRR